MKNMSAMVLCPEQTSSASATYPRYPSLPMNYPCNGFGYNAPGVQHLHDYNQPQMNDPGVQTWYSAIYGGRSEDWTYAAPNSGAMINNPTGMGAYPYRTGPMELDYNQSHGGVVSAVSPGETSSTSSSTASTSNKQLRPPYDWMKKAAYQTAPLSGKTRTKDKYRVVYSDHQRLELEKEFHYSRYITIRRKAELAQTLALSERQVKIWFQNRRAKERKQNKKRDENKVVQLSSEHGDYTDETKLHKQQQTNMQITPHAHHEVHVTSPSTETMNVHNAYTYHHCQALSQPHIIQNNSISPQNHVTNHNQFPSNQLNIPLSPETMAQSTTCSDSPVTTKADLDDKAS